MAQAVCKQLMSVFHWSMISFLPAQLLDVGGDPGDGDPTSTHTRAVACWWAALA